MNSMHRTTATLMLLSTFALPVAYGAHVRPQQQSASQPAPRVDANYDAGMKALDESRWADAVTSFDKAAQPDGERRPSALYWKAYSLKKLGRKHEATATCDQLRAMKPVTSWSHECQMLELQTNLDLNKITLVKAQAALDNVDWDDINLRLAEAGTMMGVSGSYAPLVRSYSHSSSGSRSSSGSDRSPSIDPNDDLKLLALSSLMQQEPDKALPILRDFLRSGRPVETRRRALFLLTQYKSPQSEALLTEIAMGKSDPELQARAIQTLAISRGKEAAPDLVKIYQGTDNHEVKRAALSALFISQNAPALVDLARSEKDLAMKREIVSQLSLMRDPAATAYMEELLR